MIKKAQLRFMAVMMAVFFVLFAIFFVIASNVISTSHNRAVITALIAENNSFRDSGTVHSEKTLILSFESDQVDGTYSVLNGGEYFSEETIAELVNRAASFTEGSGTFGDIFFLVTNGSLKDEQRLLLLALDGSSEMQAKQEDTLAVFIFALLLYAIIVVIVFGLSVTIFRPLKENLYRQKRFVSDASHEMRTPVAIISANADVLKNFINNTYLDSIKTQTERLEKLVSDMLALAKTDEERIALVKENFSVTDEVLEAVLPYEALLFEKGKTLITDIEPDVSVTGDRQSFKTILNVLVDNAIKHSDKNATIKISLKKEGSKAVLTVFNTGSLVREEDSARVFERFYRADASRSRDSGGSGLGLAIAKSLADANKWKIQARSVFGVSMTLTLTL